MENKELTTKELLLMVDFRMLFGVMTRINQKLEDQQLLDEWFAVLESIGAFFENVKSSLTR